MADDDKAKNDFNIILSKINRKFEIIHMKWESDFKQFEVKLRTQIPRDNEDFNSLCDEWVDLFSNITNTVWAKKISNTGPKIRFRKQYQCWTQGGKIIHKELLFDSTRCKATLDMKVLTDNPLTRRKNKHIRLGLNVVVKINFYHLHPVDITQPYAFFVHNCPPQPDIPRPVTQPNNKLPQLVAAMVQNAANVSQKVAEKAEKCIAERLNNDSSGTPQKPLLITFEKATSPHLELTNTLNQDQLNETVELFQNIPLQTLENVKFTAPSIQQGTTQFIVGTSQFDMTDHYLMCQPLLFETSQVIPFSTNGLPSHFVQIQSNLNQNGQFL
ncbi:hypothetical protein NQ317_001162 [Molorchus minor]|uniref:Uncharacterized protein n=1 Tax=Molorchus minor TaxID=1323400 RepID=A0ABQ9JWP1_9CUCU|nr:hypothetical protein NQ317_001162 [Molorchus minor]